MTKPPSLIVSLIAVSLAGLAWLAFATEQKFVLEPVQPESKVVTPDVPLNLTLFSNLELKAKSVIVYDPVHDQILFSRAPDIELPIASLTKVMTALVAAELMPPDRPIVYGNEKWRLADLSDYTLVVSSNAGARSMAAAAAALASTDFVTLMNTRARDLGLANTFFLNPTGLDLNGSAGGSYSSARDLAKLLVHVVSRYPDLLEATRHAEWSIQTLESRAVLARNTNEIINSLPGLIGSKTGFTDVASGNLGIVFDRGLNQPIVVVVLGSDAGGRFSDVSKLVNATFKVYGAEYN